MIYLQNTTFIIPVCIESIDRFNNSLTVLGYLNHHFKTNVIIHEIYSGKSKLNFLSSLKNLNILHLTEKDSGKYHRTRQLNECLSKVQTDVVCNYDIDIILPIESYIISEYLLTNSIFDVIYPYEVGMYQKQIQQSYFRESFETDFNIGKLSGNLESSEFGHCQFFKTDTYKGIGGENERFISYGPEDRERYFRCVKFNLKIHRIKDYVYHFEHSRTFNSSNENPDFKSNTILWDKLQKMNTKKLFEYYQKSEYLKKYDFKLNKILKRKENSNNKIIYTQLEKLDSKNFEDDNTIKQIENYSPIFKNNNQNLCICGQLKDKIRYNYCQRCNRLY